MSTTKSDITHLVGRTPLVELGHVSAKRGTPLLAKLECANPTGSNKDRAVLGMLKEASRTGALKEGGTVVECSAGDLGVSLAALGTRLGYRIVLVMPEHLAGRRARLLRLLGAEIVTTPTAAGMPGAMERVDQLTKEIDGAMCLQPFRNDAGVEAHATTTAQEIFEDTDGKVRAVVCPIGTGATVAGCLRFFRHHAPEVKIFGVEPAGSPVLAGGAAGRHDIPGLGAGFVPEILVPQQLDGLIAVECEDAAVATRRLIREESLLVGPASGAVLHAGLSLADDGTKGPIVLVFPDGAERFLDHTALSVADPVHNDPSNATETQP